MPVLPAVAALAAFCLLAGCAKMLPISKGTADSPWRSFVEAKAAFDAVIPYQTTRQDLVALQFDPYRASNITILNYLDVITRFMPNTAITPDDLDMGVRDCIDAKIDCQAYEIKLYKLRNRRVGNVFLDLFRFKRIAHKSGWNFDALFLLKGDTVVYKIWSGKPVIDETVYRKNPLGPLQEPAELVDGASVISVY
jgi:hypothetical protein